MYINETSISKTVHLQQQIINQILTYEKINGISIRRSSTIVHRV